MRAGVLPKSTACLASGRCSAFAKVHLFTCILLFRAVTRRNGRRGFSLSFCQEYRRSIYQLYSRRQHVNCPKLIPRKPFFENCRRRLLFIAQNKRFADAFDRRSLSRVSGMNNLQNCKFTANYVHKRLIQPVRRGEYSTNVV